MSIEASAQAAPTPVPPAIDIRNVTVSFEDKARGVRNVILDDVSLQIAPSQFTVLIGRSGCGKTTLLNVLAGLTAPDHGEVSVLGRSPVAARSDVGYMFARDALMPWRTAQGNVEFSLELRNYPRRERATRALEMLEKVHLGDAARKLPWQLSQGMRQRVALARTWVSRPEVLMMDEPFAALDAQTKHDVRSEFIDLWSQNRQTVVFVTHDLSEALLLGDRIILLNKGRIDMDLVVPFERARDPRELVQDPDFRALEMTLSERLL